MNKIEPVASLPVIAKQLNKKQKIGFIGLGKMGRNMVERLLKKKWRIVIYDKKGELRKNITKKGAVEANSLKDLAEKLTSPRIIWLMIPAGQPIKETLSGQNGLIKFLERKDVIIDGGNSFYLDSIKRYKKLSEKGIEFVDVGVSGGPEGARHGACLMVGGKEKIFKKLKPLFRDLAIENGFQFFKGQGAGHFVKMVHNGIEYGMMQAIAEGFNLIRKSNYKLDLKKVADIYSHGTVIESRLINWLEKAFERHGQNLDKVSGKVSHTGEGEWTMKTAKKLKVPVRIIEESFNFRILSQKKPSYTGKILSALREQFGKHKATK